MSNDIKPLYTYAGGKRRSLSNITPYLQRTATYVEPFFGAGAVFCFMANLMRAKRFIINDIRADVMSVYREIRDDLTNVIAESEYLVGEYGGRSVGQKETFYYEIRDQYRKKTSAAKSLFLFNTNFGGIYHEKSGTGLYNAGSGHHGPGANRKVLIDPEQLRLWHHVLLDTDICSGDFESVKIPEDDAIIYCDPPYHGAKLDYSSGFTTDDQSRCFRWCDALARNTTVSVLMTNTDDDGLFARLANGSRATLVDYPINYSAGGHSKQVEILIVWNQKRSHLIL